MIIHVDESTRLVEVRNPSLKLYGLKEEVVLYEYLTAIGQKRVKRIKVLPYREGVTYFMRKILHLKQVSEYLESVAREGTKCLQGVTLEEKIECAVREEVLSGRTNYFQSHASASARADFEALKVLLKLDESVKKIQKGKK